MNGWVWAALGAAFICILFQFGWGVVLFAAVALAVGVTTA
jgi:hypothetical protein